jgi:hypothetical protein
MAVGTIIDAAQKLDIDAPFAHTARDYGYWLEKRAANKNGIRTSTWQRGIKDSARETVG